MDAMAKSQMFINIRSGHIKHIRIWKNRWVSIGSAVPHDHFLIFGNALSGHFCVLCRRAPHVHHGRYHSQRLMTHAFNE